jgi:hypothetical protein
MNDFKKSGSAKNDFGKTPKKPGKSRGGGVSLVPKRDLAPKRSMASRAR